MKTLTICNGAIKVEIKGSKTMVLTLNDDDNSMPLEFLKIKANTHGGEIISIKGRKYVLVAKNGCRVLIRNDGGTLMVHVVDSLFGNLLFFNAIIAGCDIAMVEKEFYKQNCSEH